MKISKLFHWLYFIVMMLPIFTIPIFAIYSHRHAIDSYSVQAEETKVVNFNQILINGNFENTSYWSLQNATLSVDNNVGTVLSTDTQYGKIVHGSILSYIDNVYYIKCQVRLPNVTSGGWMIETNIGGSYSYHSFDYSTTSWQDIQFLLTSNVTNEYSVLAFQDVRSSNFEPLYVRNVQVFNFTQMFGSGNEPTISQFNSWYSDAYYDYILNDKQLLHTGNYITYNDTDIGSQFTYDVYNVVDKYFNYDSVFNFSQLYDWLNMTFFNGGASLGFFIFWHLLIYWLLTSILWLVFDVLMYVPQLVHRWLDKASLS